MNVGETTAAIQRFLDELHGPSGGDAGAVVRDLLGRAAGRLHFLCATMLHRSYPRLTLPPLGLQSDEMVGAVVERLIKAMREARPGTVRQFFALASRHMRWELNDLARRLDKQPRVAELGEGVARPPESSGSPPSADTVRMLREIDALPEEEREVFSLIRIQGLTHAEAAAILGVSAKTVQRRLNRGLMLLAESLGDLRPGGEAGAGAE